MKWLVILLFVSMGRGAPAPGPEPEDGTCLARYACSRPHPVDPGSDFNIALACAQVDGLVLKPGETLSFNQRMGLVRQQFRPGKSILAGRYVFSKGGGYCQVATALYNAFLLAGLPVLERSHHSHYDPDEAYVPAGLDAAVSSYSDLKLGNDTAGPLTLRVRKEGVTVLVELCGTVASRQRWVETALLRRIPRRTVKPADDPSPRRGFDGLVVERWLHESGPGGVTQTASLGVDRYRMVPAFP